MGKEIIKRLGRILCRASMFASVVMTPGVAQSVQRSDPLVLPSDPEIGEMLADRLDTLAGKEDGIGIVVGTIGPEGKRIISRGHRDQGDPRPMDGNTTFEIASVTKVFTGLLLAQMIHTGEVGLYDPVARYLPSSAKLPERNGQSIALVDLATHTSGLPFMPAGEVKSAADLYGYLSKYELTRDIGSQWDYSNIGYWLLGEALASRAGMEFENLLRDRVIGPLRLSNTGFALSPDKKANLAQGHDAGLQKAPATSDLPVYSLMPSAGGLYSSVNDLLKLLSAAMGYEHTPLDSSLTACLSTRRPTGNPLNEQAFGWTVIGKGQDQLIFRDGGSYGYASCVVWDPVHRVGVVALSNQAASVADLALHLLRPNIPLEFPKVTKHLEITLSANELDRHAGRYEAPEEGEFTISREGDSLMFKTPDEWGLPQLRIRPENAENFFVLELPLRVVFERGVDGQFAKIVVYPPRGQKGVTANKEKIK